MRTKAHFIFVLVISLVSCTSTSEVKSKFYFTVYSDPAFEPFIRSALETEQVRDTNYVGNLIISPEEKSVEQLLEKKTNLIFIGRPLNNEEKEYLKSIQKVPRSYELGWDALIFIRNKSDKDTGITLEKLKSLILNNPGKVLIDDPNSSNVSYLLSALKLSPKDVKLVTSGSDSAVFNTVLNNAGTTGIISYSFLADKDDPEVQKRRSQIQLLAMPDTLGKFRYPDLDGLASNYYPLKRLIYMHSTENVDGISSGMAGFMLNDKGKRLLLKMGILPYSMPEREVEITK